MNRKMLTLAIIALLAGCAEESRPVTPLTLDYTRYGKITLAVGKLEFTNRAALKPAADAGHFARFKPQLADSIYRWGVDRLASSGQRGRAILIIHDAAMTREMLPRSDSMSRWFTRQQAERWSGRAAVDIRVDDAAASFNGKASVTVARATTLPEDATEAEQQEAWRKLLLGMLDDLNTQMERAVREHLNPVVLTMPQGN